MNGLASSPYQTAVGGTDFTWSFIAGGAAKYWNTTNGTQLQNVKGYLPEVPWNSTCANPLIYPLFSGGYTSTEEFCNALIGSNYDGLITITGGSGGQSHCTTPTGSSSASCSGGYAKPTWQTGPGVPTDGKRDVPDVSLFASAGFPSGFVGSALLFCQASLNQTEKICDYTNPNYIISQQIGGTSASSPLMAGIMALIVQKTGTPQGLANPTLYKLAQAQATAGTACDSSTVASGNTCVFYDISQGTNSQVCITGDTDCVTKTSGDQVGLLSGYAATTGYDQAIGLGSMNVTNLVNAWPTTTTSGAAVSVTPTTLTFPSTAVNTTSSTQGIVTVKNTGTVALAISPLTFTGTNASSYAGSTTCPMGSTLAAGASCTVTVSFTPSTTGTLTGTLNVTDDAGVQTVSLTGTGAAASLVVGVAPSSLTFASTPTGSTAAAQTVTVSNNGNAAVTLGTVSLSGTNATSFAISANTCAASLAAAANCTVSVSFTPSSAGALSAVLNVPNNATGSPQTVALSGTAVGSPVTATLTPGALTFSSTTTGSSSAAQMATLTNTGTAALTIASGGITISGTNASSFTQTTTCGTTLAAGANCTISVIFRPTTTGSLTAVLSVADSATSSPQQVTLSGTAVAPPVTATLTPAGLTFGNTTVGTSSGAQSPTLTNTGTTALTISGITISGANASSFTQTTTCGTTLAAGASCTISVTFSPTAAGTLTAVLSVADNATGSPQQVTLIGTGVAAAPVIVATTTTLSTSAASAVVGASVTLTATVTATGATPSGTVTFYSGTASIGTGTVGANGVATLTTSFSAAGSFSITAVYAGNATTSTSTSAAVTETIVTVGVTASVTPSTLTIARGSSGTLTITVTPSGGYTGTVGLACGTLPQYATCTFAPASLTITGTTAVTDTLTIGTTTTTAMLDAPRLGGSGGAAIVAAGLWLPGSLMALFGLSRRKRLSGAARRMWMLGVLCIALGSAAMVSGCGGGSSTVATTTPTPTTNTAAAGSYTIPINLTLGTGGTSQTVSAAVVIQ